MIRAALSWLLETVRTPDAMHALIHPSGEGEQMREHATDGTDCWCQPEVRRICPECEDAREAEGGEPPCWRCAGAGTIPCEDPATYDGPHRLVILHRDVAG